VVGPSFNPLLPKQFLVHARDRALQSRYIRTMRGEGAGSHRRAVCYA